MGAAHKRISLRNQQGQAVTEFALVLPILALLLFGIIQFGIVFNHYVTITDAVRTGARKAAVGRLVLQGGGDPAGQSEAVVRASASDLNQSDLQVTVNPLGGWSQGSDVSVSASYPYQVSLLGIVVSSGNLTATTQERVE
jgi:Flp pilus assembly protein TadG